MCSAGSGICWGMGNSGGGMGGGKVHKKGLAEVDLYAVYMRGLGAPIRIC